SICKLAVAGILCATPSLLWYLIVELTTGSFMVAEITHLGQVVWISRAWSAGWFPFLTTVGQTVWFFFSNAVLQATPAWLIMMFAWIALKRSGPDSGIWLRMQRPVIEAALIVSLICLAFFTIVGWPAARLAYAAIPPLIIMAGAGAQNAVKLLPR